jgi:cholesterol transport system auxiliary component
MIGRRFAILSPFALGACSILPGQGDPPQIFTLTPKNTFAPDLPRVDAQLMVDTPTAAQGLNTARIALQRSAVTIEYYARSVWSDPAPQMVQTLLVESFENSGRIVGVSRDSTQVRPQFILLSELREFQALYERDDQAPTVLVRIIARLVRMPERRIVAINAADARARAAGTDLQRIALAFDDALGSVLRRTVEWTLRTIAVTPTEQPLQPLPPRPRS